MSFTYIESIATVKQMNVKTTGIALKKP